MNFLWYVEITVQGRMVLRQYNYVLALFAMKAKELLQMECPKCLSVLTKKYYKGIMEVDYCPNCRGMWLDCEELDKLEDMVFDDDGNKGSLIHRQELGTQKCPVCAGRLYEFQYRLYDLRLDACPENHGFWLDAGEDERVMEIMRSQQAGIHRKKNAEQEWKQVLKGLHAFLNRP